MGFQYLEIAKMLHFTTMDFKSGLANPPEGPRFWEQGSHPKGITLKRRMLDIYSSKNVQGAPEVLKTTHHIGDSGGLCKHTCWPQNLVRTVLFDCLVILNFLGIVFLIKHFKVPQKMHKNPKNYQIWVLKGVPADI